MVLRGSPCGNNRSRCVQLVHCILDNSVKHWLEHMRGTNVSPKPSSQSVKIIGWGNSRGAGDLGWKRRACEVARADTGGCLRCMTIRVRGAACRPFLACRDASFSSASNVLCGAALVRQRGQDSPNLLLPCPRL